MTCFQPRITLIIWKSVRQVFHTRIVPLSMPPQWYSPDLINAETRYRINPWASPGRGRLAFDVEWSAERVLRSHPACLPLLAVTNSPHIKIGTQTRNTQQTHTLLVICQMRSTNVCWVHRRLWLTHTCTVKSSCRRTAESCLDSHFSTPPLFSSSSIFHFNGGGWISVCERCLESICHWMYCRLVCCALCMSLDPASSREGT